jgi:hypothetical protein
MSPHEDARTHGREASGNEPSRRPALARNVGVVAALVTAAAVSSATPDGNLVVTGVPAIVAGFAAYAATAWRVRYRRRRAVPSVREEPGA